MKILVDGAVASLHRYDGTDLVEVSQRLSSRLGLEPAAVAGKLADTSRALLGPRQLLWRFGQFVQWNPADDRLARIELTARPSDAWRVSGSLHPFVAGRSDGERAGT